MGTEYKAEETEETEVELKPCPFCGMEFTFNEGHFYDCQDHRIDCPGCLVGTPDCKTLDEAVAIWNRRPRDKESVLGKLLPEVVRLSREVTTLSEKVIALTGAAKMGV